LSHVAKLNSEQLRDTSRDMSRICRESVAKFIA